MFANFPTIYTERDIFISQFYILKPSLHSRTFLLPFYYTFIVNYLTFLALTATVNIYVLPFVWVLVLVLGYTPFQRRAQFKLAFGQHYKSIFTFSTQSGPKL